MLEKIDEFITVSLISAFLGINCPAGNACSFSPTIFTSTIQFIR